MPTGNVSATRMELTGLKRKLKTARRGHKLLKDKRDELMKQFLEIVSENKSLRERVETGIARMHAAFTVAAAESGTGVIEEALMVPKTEGVLYTESKNILSVSVPVFKYEIRATVDRPVGSAEDEEDIYPYGFAFTTPELETAVREAKALLKDMMLLARAEKTAQLLADEIEKTRRRVNALEYIMIPDFESKIREITIKLDENDRGNLSRLMNVKDMMLEKARAAAE